MAILKSSADRNAGQNRSLTQCRKTLHRYNLRLLFKHPLLFVRQPLANAISLPLKGLGHAILGNFSIDQVVVELTEITK